MLSFLTVSTYCSLCFTAQYPMFHVCFMVWLFSYTASCKATCYVLQRNPVSCKICNPAHCYVTKICTRTLEYPVLFKGKH